MTEQRKGPKPPPMGYTAGSGGCLVLLLAIVITVGLCACSPYDENKKYRITDYQGHVYIGSDLSRWDNYVSFCDDRGKEITVYSPVSVEEL